MSATRNRREAKQYDKYMAERDTSRCQFCDINSKDEQFVEATRSFKVLKNIFPYSIWDNQRVVDHLLLVPKKHTDTLDHITDKQAAEYIRILGRYEQQGYNVYARAPSSVIKSVVHQHTHFIKTEGKPKHFLFLLRKPVYFRISWPRG